LDRNSIPELVELTMLVSKAEETPDESSVHVDLRVSPAQIEGPDDLSISVSVKRLTLSLDLAGLHIAPHSRFGELLKPNIDAQEKALKTETSIEGEIKGDAGFEVRATALPVISFNAGAKRTAKTTNSVSSTEKQSHVRVRARGNQTWDITEPPWEDAKHLDATYLDNDVLCKVRSPKGANARSVQLTAFAKQKELVLAAAKSKRILHFRSTNHERLMKVLIGKALSASSGEYSGIVTFSNSEVDLED
jgi:hypothetical protein